jgi:hypothetical protein
VDIHPRIARRAVEPRYSIQQAAWFIEKPTSTVRRWTIGNVRKQRSGGSTVDEPLISADGSPHGAIPLSFVNLLELRFLAAYRSRVPLQAIRRALDFAAKELEVERPLLHLEFKVHGQSLFLQWASDNEPQYLMNASFAGQLAWPSTLDEFIASVDYDEQERSAFRWWPLGRDQPVIVDTLLNGGIPSTAFSRVRTNAIAVHRGDGLDVPEIADDVGASETEVLAALRFERIAA